MYLLWFLLASSAAFTAPRYYNSSYHETSTQMSMKEVDATVVPQPARCTPEPRVVSLRTSEDLSIQYFPSCTRVDRCSGCCAVEEFFSCQPTEIEILNMRVMRVILQKFNGGNKLVPFGREIVKIEKHLKCKCDCIVKEKDCTALQRYIKQQCKCVCINHDEKDKCLQADSKLKFWDSNSCSCQCLNIKDCSTGYVFNKHTCSCESEQRQQVGGHNADYH